MAEITVESLLKRANMFLEDKEFVRANEYAERVLDIDPECAEAYLIKLCCDFKVENASALGNLKQPFTENNNYKKILRFGEESLKQEVTVFAAKAQKNALDADLKLEEQKIAVKNAQNEIYERKKAQIAAARAKILPYKNLISAGWSHSLGLKTTGEAVAAGNNYYVYSENDKEYIGHLNVTGYKNVVAVAAGQEYSVLLLDDGTVKGIGKTYENCLLYTWNDIVAVSVSNGHIAGLKKNGTAVATGANDKGQCNVSGWTNLIAVSAYEDSTIGLKKDGTVVVVGAMADNKFYNFSKFSEIIAVCGARALKSDGTVVSAKAFDPDCEKLNNIIDIISDDAFLKIDGTLITFGTNNSGRLNTDKWRNIVAASCGSSHTLGLTASGKVYATGYNGSGQLNIQNWKLVITSADLKREAESLQTELANLKGLFSGKRKKEIAARLEEIENQLQKLQKTNTLINSSSAKR